MTDEVMVHRVPMRHPGDTAGIARLIDAGEVKAGQIRAVLGKTEGNGCVNDHTRGYAVLALQVMLAERLGVSRDDVADRVAMVMSGGTEGALSPHFTVLSTRAARCAPAGGAALALGTARTRAFLPKELGRMAQVDATAEAVRQAMRSALIEDPADVHFVQVKCPLLTSERMAEAQRRGAAAVTGDTYASMAYSRGASALGAALALGEAERGALSDATVLGDFRVWSGRTSASAGIELMRNEVLVLGNSPAWGGRLRIAHGVMADAIDLDAVLAVLQALGFRDAGQVPAARRGRLLAVLAKADPGSTGEVRGRRHTMLDDSDINATRHARAVVGGVVAAAVGMTDLFISGGAEHQGPDGGGPVAIIADMG
jgi:cyanuric acid amidohydrolase